MVLRIRTKSAVLRRRRERLNAKHEMSGDTWVEKSRKSLWNRWRGKDDLNGGQWLCWCREGGGVCGGGHRRRRSNRWHPWGVIGEKGRERGWAGKNRWERVEQVMTWFVNTGERSKGNIAIRI